MPKAGAIAKELRRVADAFDRDPDAELEQPMLSFYCDNYYAEDKGKSLFLAVVRALPKPLRKNVDEDSYEVEFGRDSVDAGAPVWIRAKIDRKSVCKLVKAAQPAEFECEPLLSADEEAQLIED
jgi:hypothetical protein